MIKIGFGYDIHRLKRGRKFVLAGVELNAPFGQIGHSDGDTLIHAIIDGLLGAANLGDIGTHFPDNDAQYKNISSRIFLKKTMQMLNYRRLNIVNIDCTIILQSPRLSPYIDEIKRNLAQDLSLPGKFISIKAKTSEGLNAVGKKKAIEVYSAILLEDVD